MNCEGLICLGALIIGVGIVARMIRKRIEYYSFKKGVDSTYWGVYAGSSAEPIPDKQIPLPKITFREIITMGSAKYSKGKAVKSARG